MARNRMHATRRTILTLVFALTATSATSQEVRGRVTDASSDAPVEGAVVQLLDLEERSVAGTLTDADGRYQLRIGQPGRYWLRVERMGFASRTSEMVELHSGESMEKSFEVSEEPVRLVGITARGESRGCVVRDGSATVARVWAEARKALNAVRISESDELVLFDLQAFRREVDARTGRVRHQERRSSFGKSRNPFRSVPVEDLRRLGFVRVYPNSTVYYGPDAEVLLSDAFLDGHCFGIRESPENPELIGLEFRPLGSGTVPDIEGVLWLDRATAELRSVNYNYIGSGIDVPVERASGEIEFERVENGAWIVRRWVIRMPVLELHRSGWLNPQLGPQERSRIVVKAMIEEGGEVVEVGSKGEIRVDRPVPSEATLLSRYCPEVDAGSAGMISGYVRERDGNQPVAGATVRAKWVVDAELRGESLTRRIDESGLHVSPEGARIDVRMREVEVTADERGFYHICGTPLSGQAEVEASAAGHSVGRSVTVRLAPVVARDLTLGP